MSNDKTFADYDRNVEKYGTPDDFDRFKRGFSQMDVNSRIETLKMWDGLFEMESRPTRDLGRRITQMREITDIHNLLLRSNR